MSTFPYTAAQLEAIAQDTERRRAVEPRAQSVTYDAASGQIAVTLSNGATIAASARTLDGLHEATDEQLANVRLFNGDSLWWDALDVQYSLIAFLSLVLEVPTASFLGRRGGRARTSAKAKAARLNGAKGGRPRKPQAA